VAHGTAVAGRAVAHGTVVAGRAVNHGVDEAMFRTGMAGVRALHGAENTLRATQAAARWTGREVKGGYQQGMARPSPLADRLERYAAGSNNPGRHRRPRGGSGS
jgi:hypothetical protein